jgi:hypothetical protein
MAAKNPYVQIGTDRGPTAEDLFRAFMPGTLRVSMTIYDAHQRAYRQVPEHTVRVLVRSQKQARAIWAAISDAVVVATESWPRDEVAQEDPRTPGPAEPASV